MLRALEAVEEVHVHLHLPEILVRELVELEVDEDVTAEEAFVEAGGFLAFQLRHGPAFVGGLDLVEATLVRVFDGEEEDVVGPTEGEGFAELPSGLLENLKG